MSAGMIRALLLGQLDAEVHSAGLYAGGATVVGPLDLRFCTVDAPFRFRSCSFTDRPLLGVSDLAGVEFRDCEIPGLWADRARIRYSLGLNESVVDGRVSLVGAEIGDVFTASAATITCEGSTALNATLARVGGSVHLDKGFECAGPIYLMSAHVGGDLTVDGASVNCTPASDAVTLDFATVIGSVRGKIATTGAFRMVSATIGGDIDLGGVIDGEADSGLIFHGAQVTGAVEISATVTGAVGGYGSTIGDLKCSHASLSNPGGAALDLGRATIQSNVDVRPETSFDGEVTLIGADVRGGVLVSGAELRNDRGFALVMDFARIGGNIDISDEAEVLGGITLVQAKVEGGLLAHRCHIDGAGRDAIAGDRCTIGGNVHLHDGASVSGATRLSAATVGGSVMLRSASLTAEAGDALDLRLTTMGLGFLLRDSHVRGGVDLYNAQAIGLDDDLGEGPGGMGSWSEATPLVLNGFAYKTLAGDASYDRKQREEWLRRTQTHEPESWAQLEQAFRSTGRRDDGRHIAIAAQRDRTRRGGLTRRARAWRTVLDITIGHGYATARAAAWGLLVILIFAFLIALAPDLFTVTNGKQSISASSPQPLIYAADAFLPVIDFGEASTWKPTSWMRWAEWIVILLGWTLTTLFVAGFTRIVRD